MTSLDLNKIEALIGTSSPAEEGAVAPDPCDPGSVHATRSAFDLPAWIARHELQVGEPAPWNGGLRWKFLECPWRPEDGPDAFLIQHGNGAISAGCQHATCPGSRGTGNHWRDLREKYEGGHPTHDCDPLATELCAVETTEFGLATRFTRRWGDSCRYCFEWSSWFTFHEGRWRKDGAEPQRLAMDTVKALEFEATAYGIVNPHNLPEAGLEIAVSAYFAWAHTCQKESFVRHMLELAKHMAPIDITEMDKDPMLLNLPNGVLECRTGQHRPHDPKDLVTMIGGVKFDAGAKAPLFIQFLDRIFEGDESLISYIQRVVGYTLTGNVGEQVFFLLHGVGANGKSTLMDVLSTILGDYAGAAPPGLLMQRKNESHPTELADLFGKRLLVASEVKQDAKWDEERLKSLTGGDKIKGRRMRQDFWEFSPTHKLWILVNHPPVTEDCSPGFWRRVHLIPFAVTIPPEERDPALAEKLKAEGPGILNWALEGCRLWQEEGLNPPEAVKNATAAYQEESDPVHQFFLECCEKACDGRTGSSDLYRAYTLWSHHLHREPLSQRVVAQRIKGYGFGTVKSNGVSHFCGLRLRSIEEDPLDWK